ncbi:antibiotic biosynthesis monooxygenase family protein [Pontibacter silvestris]|uniref:Antibiotic biosynthesis monooxygenase family protein n=1 Tax=Pontibacter silvestris TaxID=2305183 RepID=A0ABW4WUW6_9BACT|nr:antibiotic biosynthesis monooxygenase [Pontibacter silvestris]MCC9137722.1 antibiotic biosynthesis monooxygenase [Pontibacter silvestris]
MFISISSFVIANDMGPEVKEAFRNRPHLVENAAGFIKLQVLSPHENPNEIWLMTYWTDEESFQVWYKSHMYHDVHKGIPKGLKLVPGSVQVRGFEHVAE